MKNKIYWDDTNIREVLNFIESSHSDEADENDEHILTALYRRGYLLFKNHMGEIESLRVGEGIERITNRGLVKLESEK